MFALHLSTNLSTVALQKDWIMPAIERSSDPNCPEQLKWTDPGLDALVNVIWPKARKKMKVIILAIIIVWPENIKAMKRISWGKNILNYTFLVKSMSSKINEGFKNRETMWDGLRTLSTQLNRSGIYKYCSIRKHLWYHLSKQYDIPTNENTTLANKYKVTT